MKNALRLMLMLCMSGFLANFTYSQNTNQSYKTNFPKPTESKRLEEFVSENEVTNEYWSKNKLDLVKGSSFRNKTTAVLNVKSFTVILSGEMVTPNKPDPDNILPAFSVGLNKKFQSFESNITNTFYLKHRKRFGLLETDVSKIFKPTEGVSVRVYTGIASVYAIQDSNNDVSNGFFSFTGLEFKGKLNKGELSIKPQVILDKDALQKGRRIANGVEVQYLFPVGRTFVGPRVEYIHFSFANQNSYLVKRNKLAFGFIVQVK